jgi:nucleoside-diphosphate-sugar epimerase
MSTAPQNILVTGGAGYIGSVLVPDLLDAGHRVTVLDTFASNNNELATACRSDRFTPVRGDVRDDELVRRVAADADIVIPLAALVGAPLCARDPWRATQVNLDAIKSLLGMLSPEQRVIYPNSNSGYGIGTEGEFCTEESPLNPISLYGKTKVEAEAAVLERGNAVTFRLATVFGIAPRLRVDLLVNDFTYRAVTDRVVVVFEGHFKRNYIHVRDVAKAFMHAMENFEEMKDQPYNVGLSGANLSKLELCAAIERHVPGFTYLEAPLGKDPDQRNYIVSNERIEATGFRPDWSLDDGIAELLKGYEMVRNTRFTNI